jgi:hypothetical protein
MPHTTISPERQKEILTAVRRAATWGERDTSREDYERHLIMFGVSLALGPTCPPHWVINIQCGRTDRLFEEEPQKKNYDVLGLKGETNS